MLDTLREYGHDWLRELGQADAVAERHAEHFTRLAPRTETRWAGSEQTRCYRRVEDAHTELRAALDHWLARDPRRAADLAASLLFSWTCCGRLKESRSYLEPVLAAHPTPGPARTRALTALGVTATLQGEYALAGRRSAEATAAARDDGAGAAQENRFAAAYLSGLLDLLAGQAARARDTVRDEPRSAPGSAFDSPDRPRCHLVEVFAQSAHGALSEARAQALELRSHCARTGEIWTRSNLDHQLAPIALPAAEPRDAVAHSRTMPESKRLLGDACGGALGLDLLAAAPAAGGLAEQAASVYGVGASYWRSVGHPQRGTPELGPVRERCEATAREAWGDAGYAAAYARGAAAGGLAAPARLVLPDQPGHP